MRGPWIEHTHTETDRIKNPGNAVADESCTSGDEYLRRWRRIGTEESRREHDLPYPGVPIVG